MAVGKSKKTGSRSMIECKTCKMWVDLESCKGLTEMSQSERTKLVFDCWKCMVDERVKMAEVNMKKEEEIKRLKAEVVFLKRELENGRKLKGEEDVRSKRRVDGDGKDSVRFVEEYERLCKEVNRDLHEKILAMKVESIRKREVGYSFLDMDELIQAGCFLEDGVHLSQEGETKLSQRFIRWIRATHLLMEGRMD
ncbi:hypothetical protein FHG87_006530 [Trinorchestia longiramus]|nr:hypothetical protein FHG87_006530 [Trinorchestia longiramus]